MKSEKAWKVPRCLPGGKREVQTLILLLCKNNFSASDYSEVHYFDIYIYNNIYNTLILRLTQTIDGK